MISHNGNSLNTAGFHRVRSYTSGIRSRVFLHKLIISLYMDLLKSAYGRIV